MQDPSTARRDVPPAAALPGAGMDSALDLVLEFKPTLRRQGLLIALLVAAFGVAMVVSVHDTLHAFALPWRVLAMLVLGLPAAWLAVVLARQALSDQPVVRLDHQGISGAALREPVAWSALDDVVLHLGASASRLQMVCKRGAPRTGSRSLFNVAGSARKPQISLHLLDARQQQELFYAIHARLALLRAQAGAGVSASLQESRADEEFEDRLDRLTPRTWAVYAVVAANLLVWAMNLSAGLDFRQPSSVQLYAWGANSASGVVVDGEWWRLIAATFLHGGVMHIAFNMLGLWDAGKQLCRLLGNWQFLLVYLAAALCGSAAGLHFTAQTTTSVGASGAIFGVLGALLSSSIKYRHHLPAYNRGRLWTGLVIFLGYSLASGFTEHGIDNSAHIGGLVGGAVLGLLLRAPFDDASPAAERRWMAGLGLVVTTGTVVAAVLATPVPAVWTGETHALSNMLPLAAQRYDTAMRQLTQEERRWRTGETSRLQYLQNAERAVGPPCRAVATTLAAAQAPLWEPQGRSANFMRRHCEITSDLLTLELARERRDPRVPPDVDAILVRLLQARDRLFSDNFAPARRQPPDAARHAPERTR